jgi:hypothetical protein
MEVLKVHIVHNRARVSKVPDEFTVKEMAIMKI